MIAYRKTNGRAHDIRFVADGYQAIAGETLIEGDVLPSALELSDPIDPVVAHNAQIDAQIRALESASGGYMRGLREFMLAQTQVNVAAGGPDFMANKGMQNVKALDDAIRALRAQRQ